MPLTDAQKTISRSNSRFKVVAAGRRFGKALSVDTPVLTDSGFKRMLDVSIGDKVFSPDGNLVSVLNTSEVLVERTVYRILFSDGSVIDCDEDHEWFVESKKFRKQYARGSNVDSIKRIYTTREMVEEGVRIKRSDGKFESNFSIPNTEPLQMDEKDFLFDPYSLGYWLGDGNSDSPRLTIGSDDEIEVISNFAYPIWKTKSPLLWSFGAKGRKRTSDHGRFKKILSDLGVLNNKHIPEEYFFGSFYQRLSLVQGLMDSDGSVSKKGHCEFTSTNKELASGFYRIISTLGIKSTILEGDALLNGGFVSKKYRVCFSTDVPVFRLTRKLRRLFQHKRKKDIYRRFIVSIERIDSVPVKCIEVDSEDHLYLAGESLIPTHNSYLSMSQMARSARFPYSQVWYVTTTYSAAKNIMWSVLKERLQRLGWAKRFHEVALQATLVNGSVISLKGANNPDSLRGIGLDYLVLDEAAYLEERVWTEVLRPTLSDKVGGALFISSPSGRNWFYDLWEDGQDPDEDDWESWQYTTLEGGNVPPEEVEAARRNLDARTFEQEYEARFVTYTGLVYYGFDHSESVVDRGYEPGQPVYIGMDFNIDPMTATVFQMDENDGTLFIIDEIEIFGSNTDEMAEEILTRYPEDAITIYPDPACVQTRTSAGGRTDLSILQSYGFKCKFRRKHPLIRDRINAVNSRLCSADGNRYLFVHKKCKRTIHALERHSYKKGTNLPEKGGEGDLSHITDSVGYLVEYMYPVNRQEIEVAPIFGV